jgi:D-sedoheptulose 7-phosphate isomerase
MGSDTEGQYFRDSLVESSRVMAEAADSAAALQRLAEALAASLSAGGTVFWCGNGGSASDSQHLAAELVGRYRRNRRPLASIALTTDTSILTALANDFGYEIVFARQIEALGRAGDVLVGLSTSGQSRNVLLALEAARAKGLVTVALTGSSPSPMWDTADHVIAAPSTLANHIQEVHIAVGQALCGYLEEHLTTPDGDSAV